MREDDPRCAELEVEGYGVVSYSWGATLRIDDSSDLAMSAERVRRVRNEGFNICELSSTDLAKVREVEFANVNDYPQSAATHHEMPTLEFTSVLAEYRGRGLGAAVKAASISTLFNEGVRWFSTGGAVSNEASLGANRTLGYVLEPTWRTYSITRK